MKKYLVSILLFLFSSTAFPQSGGRTTNFKFPIYVAHVDTIKAGSTSDTSTSNVGINSISLRIEKFLNRWFTMGVSDSLKNIGYERFKNNWVIDGTGSSFVTLKDSSDNIIARFYRDSISFRKDLQMNGKSFKDYGIFSQDIILEGNGSSPVLWFKDRGAPDSVSITYGTGGTIQVDRPLKFLNSWDDATATAGTFGRHGDTLKFKLATGEITKSYWLNPSDGKPLTYNANKSAYEARNIVKLDTVAYNTEKRYYNSQVGTVAIDSLANKTTFWIADIGGDKNIRRELQYALNNANSNGTDIYLPAAVDSIDSTIRISGLKNIRILGSKQTRLVASLTWANDTMISINDADSNIVIEGFTLDANSKATVGIHVLGNTVGVKRITLRDLEIMNVAGTATRGIFVNYNSAALVHGQDNVLIDHCYIHGVGASDGACVKVANSAYVTIQNCDLDVGGSIGSNAVSLVGTKHITVNNNRIKGIGGATNLSTDNQGRGIGSFAGYWNKYTKNTINGDTSVSAHGIYLDTDGGAKIEGNTVLGCDNGIMVELGQNVSISGNTLSENRTTGIYGFGRYDTLLQSNLENTTGLTASANVTLSRDATDYREGSASVKAIVGASFTTGNLFYHDTTSALSWTYPLIRLWVKSSISIPYGYLQLVLSSTAGLGNVITTANLPYIQAGHWKLITLSSDDWYPKQDASVGLGVMSWGIKATVDFGADTLHFDKLMLDVHQSGLTIANNTIDRSGRFGMQIIDNYENVNIEGNTISNMGWRKNTSLTGDEGSGILVQALAIDTVSHVNNVNILGNIIAGSHYPYDSIGTGILVGANTNATMDSVNVYHNIVTGVATPYALGPAIRNFHFKSDQDSAHHYFIDSLGIGTTAMYNNGKLAARLAVINSVTSMPENISTLMRDDINLSADNSTAHQTVQVQNVVKGSGNISGKQVGLQGEASVSTNSGKTVTEAGGVVGIGRNDAAGTGTLLYGVQGQIWNTSTGNNTNGYGVYVPDASKTSTGVTTNLVGLKIDNQTLGTNNYSMQVGNAPSYHVGKLTLGQTTVGDADLYVKGRGMITADGSLSMVNRDLLSIRSLDTTTNTTTVRYGVNVRQNGHGDTTNFIGIGGYDTWLIEDTSNGLVRSGGRTINTKRPVLVGYRAMLQPYSENFPYRVARDVAGYEAIHVGYVKGSEAFYVGSPPDGYGNPMIDGANNPDRHRWYADFKGSDTSEYGFHKAGAANIGFGFTGGLIGNNPRAFKSGLTDQSELGTLSLGVQSLTSGQEFTAVGDGSFSGYLRVGSNTAPANTTAGDLTATRLSVGNGGLGSGLGYIASLTGTLTDLSGTQYGVYSVPTLNAASRSTADFRSLNIENTVDPNCDTLNTLEGIYAINRFNGRKSATKLSGVYATGFHSNSTLDFGTVSSVYGVELYSVNHFTNIAAGTITEAAGMYVHKPGLSSGDSINIPSMIGVKIDTSTGVNAAVYKPTYAANLSIGTNGSGNWSIHNNSSEKNYFGGKLDLAKSISKVNNVATVGSYGVPAIADTILLGATGVVAQDTIKQTRAFAITSRGFYQMPWEFCVTTADASSTANITVNVYRKNRVAFSATQIVNVAVTSTTTQQGCFVFFHDGTVVDSVVVNKTANLKAARYSFQATLHKTSD